jgi:hypothetical protein
MVNIEREASLQSEKFQIQSRKRYKFISQML